MLHRIGLFSCFMLFFTLYLFFGATSYGKINPRNQTQTVLLFYWALFFASYSIATSVQYWLLPLSHTLPFYVYVVANIMISIIPGRIARKAALATIDQITKEAYVRYISHELRTPMNAMQMRIQYSIEQNTVIIKDTRTS